MANDTRSKEALRTWLRLLSCEIRIEQLLRARLREQYQMTLPQFDVLSELEHADGPLTMSELSRELMVSNGNITGVIDRLEKQQLVRRSRPDHDRRVQFIELTRRGAKRFREMAVQHETWVAELLVDLSTAEMKRLQKLLLAARESVQANHDV